jgi:hypothetical protein
MVLHPQGSTNPRTRKALRGSRILAEVFISLLEADSCSFLSRSPDWKPTLLPTQVPGTFTMVDFLNFVGDINPIG